MDMEIQYTNVKINIPESWDDLTLKQYIEYEDIVPKIKQEKEGEYTAENLLNMMRLVEIITGSSESEIDSLLIPEMNDLSTKVSEFIVNVKPNFTLNSHIIIDGVDYVCKDPNQLDNGEYITLNILKEQNKNTMDLLPKLLSVLIRPGSKKVDKETDEEYWEVEPFNRRDMLNINYRADLFLNKAKARDMVPALNFFLTMSER
jgi:hypothetical protein